MSFINERRNAGEQYYYHYNHIGSTMAVSDPSGGVLYRFVYDTYGELSDIKTDDGISLKNSEIVSDKTKDYTVEELAHAAGMTYLYNGQYGVATDQNGLYYMRARYYDQDIKRFINRDIVSGDISNSKSLNRYAYVQGNPVSLTDPFGLCPDSNSSVRLVRTFLCDTDWSTVGHTALDIVGIFWDGADVINAFWYAAEGNTEMAIASAVYALPGIGMASGRLMMCSDKLYKAGKAVYRASKLTQGGYGVVAGLTMAGAGIGNIYNSLKNGEKISFKDIALAVGGIAIACVSGKTLVSDMRQMLGISNKVDRTIKVGNADISHEPVPSEKKILEAAESGRAAKGGNVGGGGINGETTALTVYDPEFAARQLLIGGETSEERLRSIIPQGTPNTFIPSENIAEGYKYNFSINGKKIEIKWHSEDLNAALQYPGSNAGSGWTAQIKIGNKLLGQDGSFYRKARNITHIPLR